MHDVNNVLDVVDLIHARVHALKSVHPFGDVARDGHPQAMGLGADGFHILQFY